MLPQMTRLRVGLATNVAKILPQTAHGGCVPAVAQLLLTFFLIQVLLLVVGLYLVSILKVCGAELTRQHQALATLAEPRKVVIAAIAARKAEGADANVAQTRNTLTDAPGGAPHWRTSAHTRCKQKIDSAAPAAA